MNKAHTTGYIAPVGRYVPPVLFNPYTGEPRDARDISSDPRGVLIVPPGALLTAAASAPVVMPEQWPTADDVALAYEDAFAQKPQGRLWANITVLAEALRSRRALLAEVSAPAPQAQAGACNDVLKVVHIVDSKLRNILAEESERMAQPSDTDLLSILGGELDSGNEAFIKFARTVLAMYGTAAPAAQVEIVDFIAKHYVGPDFAWGNPETEVMVIEMPRGVSYCGDFRADIAAAIAAQASKQGGAV